jgi:predicted nucleotidyltransferase
VVDAIQKVLPMAQEIWFHGSRATGKHRRNSDTDILVVVPDDLVGDQYLAVVRILQKLASHFDNYDIQPTKSGTNIHRIAQEEGQLLWANKQDVAEAFDQPYKTKSEKSDYGDVDMLAKLPDGTNLSIMFNQEYGDEGEEVVQVEFYRNNSQEVTGEGDAQRIFATVIDAIQKYIKKYKPQRLSFSASKAVDMDADDNGAQFNPESRAKLYDRLVQRYSKALGYRAFRADNGDIVIYELSRLKPAVAEEQLDELSFLGSECTKDCSGHRAGYEWSKRKGLRQANSLYSPSFNKGAALAVAGK